MALPGPGTFSSLSAETPCYTFNYTAGAFAPTQNIIYVDCNGIAGRTQLVSGGGSGNFCARSITDDGSQITITQAGSCACKSWYTRVFNSAAGRDYTFAWLDCNGQPAQKRVITAGIYGEASFYACSKSKPVMIISGGPFDITQEAYFQYCNRSVVG